MSAPPLSMQQMFLDIALCVIVLAMLIGWYAYVTGKKHDRSILLLSVIAVSTSAVSIMLRWNTYGYGPFMTLYEVLVSNFLSLGVIFIFIYVFIPISRPASLVVLPVLCLIGLWAKSSDTGPVELPATYDTALLWVHVGVGKVFLGLCLVAFGLSGILWMRYIKPVKRYGSLPSDNAMNHLAWQLMAVAFVFHSLMLIAGAAWAQQAWGRFWAWDSLETWAFITWLVMGLSLHARLTWKLPDWSGWFMIMGVFVLAMLTFFGVPFTSVGPHKGII